MKELKKEFIIAYDKKEKNIVTMKIEVKNPSFYNKERGSYKDFNKFEFTASFNVGELVNIDDENKNAYNYYESIFDDCYDAEAKLNLLNGGERTKKDVIDEWLASEYDYRERIDCSCTDYEFTYKNITYNFITAGCGQHDIRTDSNNWIFVNNKVDNLLKMWDQYHLKEINESNCNKLIEILKDFEKFEHDEAIIEIAKNKFFDEV